MEIKAFHDNHFDSIQTLRGIAAILVILEHVRFLKCGAFGVDIFFCISGFMIMFATHKSTKNFFRKRIIRIIPLYYIMTIGTYLLLLILPGMFEQTKANPVFLVKSLLFIPFDIGNGILQPLMRIGWTVNCEMFFYLVFFIAFHINQKYRGLVCSAILSLVVVFAQVFPVSFAPLNFYGNPVMLEFVLGIICYYICQKLYEWRCQNKLSAIFAPLSLLIAFILFCLLIITMPSINILGFRRLLFWGFPGMLLVLCFFLFGLFSTVPRFTVLLGNMSFSIYLVHYYPIMFLDRVVFDFSVCTPYTVFGTVLAALLCLGLSYICFLLIEKRLTGLLRRLFHI